MLLSSFFPSPSPLFLSFLSGSTPVVPFFIPKSCDAGGLLLPPGCTRRGLFPAPNLCFTVFPRRLCRFPLLVFGPWTIPTPGGVWKCRLDDPRLRSFPPADPSTFSPDPCPALPLLFPFFHKEGTAPILIGSNFFSSFPSFVSPVDGRVFLSPLGPTFCKRNLRRRSTQRSLFMVGPPPPPRAFARRILRPPPPLLPYGRLVRFSILLLLR